MFASVLIGKRGAFGLFFIAFLFLFFEHFSVIKPNKNGIMLAKIKNKAVTKYKISKAYMIKSYKPFLSNSLLL